MKIMYSAAQNNRIKLSHRSLSDIRSESKYPRVPSSPKPESLLSSITTERSVSFLNHNQGFKKRSATAILAMTSSLSDSRQRPHSESATFVCSNFPLQQNPNHNLKPWLQNKFLNNKQTYKINKSEMCNIKWISYMETTADPSHVTPFHDSPHGSPPPIFQPVSWVGLFNALYMTSRAWTATEQKNNKNYKQRATKKHLLNEKAPTQNFIICITTLPIHPELTKQNQAPKIQCPQHKIQTLSQNHTD